MISATGVALPNHLNLLSGRRNRSFTWLAIVGNISL
jgi:hypothetical protein